MGWGVTCRGGACSDWSEVCPVCDHPQSYFALKAENY